MLNAAYALGPHEIVLLVNQNSLVSKEIANHYIQWRKIPSQNVISLSLPESFFAGEVQVSPENFRTMIFDPTLKAIKERHLDKYILAWIYSADFPIRITSPQPMSLQGITFSKGQVVEAEQIKTGSYRSRLFCGPDKANGPQVNGGTLDQYKNSLKEKMPIPSMMLSYVGTNGLTKKEALTTLRSGMIADHSFPTGTIFFIKSDDVRSTCRDWQFPGAAKELKKLGVQAVITTNFPVNQTSIMGVQMGNAYAFPRQAGIYLPGSMAEHLTSLGAVFHHPEQTKLTAWLQAGATASAGTVVEPYSVWPKFPHARFYCHYARGYTLLESFYLSIRSPSQILLVGEPLAQPWAPPFSITFVSLDDHPKKKRTFYAQVSPSILSSRVNYRYYLDGKDVTQPLEQETFHLDTEVLSDGYHELRAVAYTQGSIHYEAFSVQTFDVQNTGKRVELIGLAPDSTIDFSNPIQLQVHVKGTQKPQFVGVMNHERLLGKKHVQDETSYTFEYNLDILGAGPNRLQAIAFYEDEEVRGKPLYFEIKQTE